MKVIAQGFAHVSIIYMTERDKIKIVQHAIHIFFNVNCTLPKE